MNVGNGSGGSDGNGIGGSGGSGSGGSGGIAIGASGGGVDRTAVSAVAGCPQLCLAPAASISEKSKQLQLLNCSKLLETSAHILIHT